MQADWHQDLQGDGRLEKDQREDDIGGHQAVGDPVQVTDSRKIGVEKEESGAKD